MGPHAFFLQDSCEFLYNFQFVIKAALGLNALSMRDATGLVFVGAVNKRKAVLLHYFFWGGGGGTTAFIGPGPPHSRGF